MATFLKQFQTVVSLNYDFLVYWAMLAANERWGCTWFKDCFLKGTFEEDWERLRAPYGAADGATLVFYPHGNLVLATDLYGNEIKLANNDYESLLDSIVRNWESGTYTPLFVSEGTCRQKLQAIYRSRYLLNVYTSVLGDLGSNVVVFGWSMSDQDVHILDAICSNTALKVLAVSVRMHGDIESRCNQIEKKIRAASGDMKREVVFFDPESEGCWVSS
jgi:hypothetical protein